MKEQLITAIAELKEEEAMSLVRSMLDAGEDPQVILDATSEAVRTIGDRFEAQEYFLPELIIAGDLMKQIAELVKPKLATESYISQAARQDRSRHGGRRHSRHRQGCGGLHAGRQQF